MIRELVSVEFIDSERGEEKSNFVDEWFACFVI